MRRPVRTSFPKSNHRATHLDAPFRLIMHRLPWPQGDPVARRHARRVCAEVLQAGPAALDGLPGAC